MRLAAYGSLMRGEPNHYEVRSIPGTWSQGTVRGWTYEITWGPADGYDGITLDAAGPTVTVDVLESDELDRHLDRLDRFEGPGYRRITVPVIIADGTETEAWIYETDPDA